LKTKEVIRQIRKTAETCEKRQRKGATVPRDYMLVGVRGGKKTSAQGRREREEEGMERT